ncbi:MAG: type II toxin-antitoxin system Phd/YefM family antitoxin [Mollicutes bacterium]|nr:type II toxin-antitoxin system Phd/YefM family antitoxin [Mollicutes bacterium]
MQTFDITEVKKDIFSLADRLKKSTAPLLVVNSFGSNFVMISEDEWNNIQEALSLASIPGYGKTIAKARKEDYSKKKPYLKSMETL